MTTEAPVVIFDLDGTLIDGNSFHELVRLMVFGGRLRRLVNMPDRLALAAVASLRAMRLLRRAPFKKYVHFELKSNEDAPFGQEIMQLLLVRLHELARPDVHAALEQCRSLGIVTVLATAGFSEYAEPYAHAIGIDNVVATEYERQDWRENIGQVKSEMTLKALADIGHAEEPRILIADHAADWPLADECDVRLWLEPSAIRDCSLDARFTLHAFDSAVTRLSG